MLRVDPERRPEPSRGGAIEWVNDPQDFLLGNEPMTGLPLDVFRSALDPAADVVMITDAHTRIRYVNATFTRVTGYTAAEATGKKPNVQGSPLTTHRQYEEAWRVILSRGGWPGELVNRRKSGEEWNARISIARLPGPDGLPAACVAVETDGTVRRIREQFP